MMENKHVLITGGGGSIGSELVRQLALKNKVYVLDIDETAMFDLVEEQRLLGYNVKGRVGDIRDRETVRAVFQEFFDIVFHAAAYKHVAPMEHYPREAIQTNLIGLCNVLDECKRTDTKLIFISSDKAVNVNSVMGITKRLGEIIVKNAGYVSVRFGNVLGSRGSVIPLWQRQLDQGEALTVTDPNMERYFMTVKNAVELVLEAAEVGVGGEIMILDMGKQVKIIDIAERIIAESTKDGTIRIIGKKAGETLSEKIMTPEEESRATKNGKFFIIS